MDTRPDHAAAAPLTQGDAARLVIDLMEHSVTTATLATVIRLLGEKLGDLDITGPHDTRYPTARSVTDHLFNENNTLPPDDILRSWGPTLARSPHWNDPSAESGMRYGNSMGRMRSITRCHHLFMMTPIPHTHMAEHAQSLLRTWTSTKETPDHAVDDLIARGASLIALTPFELRGLSARLAWPRFLEQGGDAQQRVEAGANPVPLWRMLWESNADDWRPVIDTWLETTATDEHANINTEHYFQTLERRSTSSKQDALSALRARRDWPTVRHPVTGDTPLMVMARLKPGRALEVMREPKAAPARHLTAYDGTTLASALWGSYGQQQSPCRWPALWEEGGMEENGCPPPVMQVIAESRRHGGHAWTRSNATQGVVSSLLDVIPVEHGRRDWSWRWPPAFAHAVWADAARPENRDSVAAILMPDTEQAVDAAALMHDLQDTLAAAPDTGTATGTPHWSIGVGRLSERLSVRMIHGFFLAAALNAPEAIPAWAERPLAHILFRLCVTPSLTSRTIKTGPPSLGAIPWWGAPVDRQHDAAIEHELIAGWAGTRLISALRDIARDWWDAAPDGSAINHLRARHEAVVAAQVRLSPPRKAPHP